MHIVLLILKIIGIVILSLLGVLLALILLVLFVPLRYNIKGEKENEKSLEADVRVNWLLHIVSFTLKYKEKVSYRLRIFGITVLKGDEELSSKEDGSSEEDKQQRQSYKESKKKVEEQPSLNEKEHEKTDLQKENSETVSKETSVETTPVKITKKNEQPAIEDKMHKIASKQEINTGKTGKTKTKVEKIWERIHQFFTDGWNQIKDFFYKVKQFFMDFCQKKDRAVKMFEEIKDFFVAPENKVGILAVWDMLKKLGKHCGPQKSNYKVRFGTGNPAKTGQILGIVSGVGGMIGIMPNIIPEFQEEVLEADFFMKGRIKLYYLIWLLIGIWKNEDFHKLKNNFEKIRRNLDGRE